MPASTFTLTTATFLVGAIRVSGLTAICRVSTTLLGWSNSTRKVHFRVIISLGFSIQGQYVSLISQMPCLVRGMFPNPKSCREKLFSRLSFGPRVMVPWPSWNSPCALGVVLSGSTTATLRNRPLGSSLANDLLSGDRLRRETTKRIRSPKPSVSPTKRGPSRIRSFMPKSTSSMAAAEDGHA